MQKSIKPLENDKFLEIANEINLLRDNFKRKIEEIDLLVFLIRSIRFINLKEMFQKMKK